MREVMSTEIRDFKDVAKDFMHGSRISMMVCLYDHETEQMVIHGAWSKTTVLEDLVIEVDEMDDDMIIMHTPEIESKTPTNKRFSVKGLRRKKLESR